MPLIPTILIQELSRFMDSKSSSFQGFPGRETVGQAWADAVDAYAAAIIPPSTTSPACKTALAGALAGMSSPNGALVVLPAGFTGYAAVLGGGMAPTFIATPPPVPLNLSPAFSLGMSRAPAAEVIAQIAALVDAWFRTGIAVPLIGGPSVPWS
jgi:hypothetical protein